MELGCRKADSEVDFSLEECRSAPNKGSARLPSPRSRCVRDGRAQFAFCSSGSLGLQGRL